MKPIKQFFIGGMGDIYFLYEDNTMEVGEMEHVESSDKNETNIKVNITKKIILPD